MLNIQEPVTGPHTVHTTHSSCVSTTASHCHELCLIDLIVVEIMSVWRSPDLHRKHSDSASHQEHIWMLLAICPNPQLPPVSPLPCHYLPQPTEYALHGTSCTLFLTYDTQGLFPGSWRHVGILRHAEYVTLPAQEMEWLKSVKAKLLFIESVSNKVHAQSQIHQHMRKLNKIWEIFGSAFTRAVYLCS